MGPYVQNERDGCPKCLSRQTCPTCLTDPCLPRPRDGYVSKMSIKLKNGSVQRLSKYSESRKKPEKHYV